MLVEALGEFDDYLSDNNLNTVGSGSILHQICKQALTNPSPQVTAIQDVLKAAKGISKRNTGLLEAGFYVHELLEAVRAYEESL